MSIKKLQPGSLFVPFNNNDDQYLWYNKQGSRIPNFNRFLAFYIKHDRSFIRHAEN